MTALGIAAIRAIERERPPSERIVDDPYARHFVGEYLHRMLYNLSKLGMSERRGPGVVGWLLARERVIDEYLLQMAAEGIDQLVILGAGYDARAYRFARKLGNAHVFEVDTPATQAAKRERVEMFLDEVDLALTFVPVDFETQTLTDELKQHGYDPSKKTLHLIQGVFPYLTAEAVDNVLAFIQQDSAPGSAVVFDFIDEDVVAGKIPHAEIRSTNLYGYFRGEQIQFGIPINDAEMWLRSRGFDDVTSTPSALLHARYFQGENVNRQVASGYGILFGRVPDGSNL
jgi:methyltransferase (TIGR00027 family)